MRLFRMISLNQTEQQFIAYLDTFSRSLVPPVECRIAGGWVRDKVCRNDHPVYSASLTVQILSLPSNDLDIALSIPSGHTFAVDFVDYLKSKGITTGSVGKVAVNPEQSKHLETGTTKILGLECDFVGLRSETYADTRIPEVVRQSESPLAALSLTAAPWDPARRCQPAGPYDQRSVLQRPLPRGRGPHRQGSLRSAEPDSQDAPRAPPDVP